MEEVYKVREVYDKCNKLTEKLQNEKSAVKRILYITKLKMLISKLQNEINISQIREDFKIDRQEIERVTKEGKVQLKREIANLAKQINGIKSQIKKYSQYDYESENFIYPKSEVEKEGGIDQYIEGLRESDLVDEADIIEAVLEIRRNLKAKEQELESKQQELSDLDKNNAKNLKMSNKKQKSLIKKENGSVFEKIALFFKGLTEGMKFVIQDVTNKISEKKVREQKISQINKDEAISKSTATLDYEEAVRRVKLEYERRLSKIKEEYDEEIENIVEYSYAKKEQAKQDSKESVQKLENSSRTQQINKFKKELRKLAIEGNFVESQADTNTHLMGEKDKKTLNENEEESWLDDEEQWEADTSNHRILDTKSDRTLE